MATFISGCGLLSRPPKGDLIYCSYAQTGAAGLGKDYCELIADERGELPARLNRGVLSEDGLYNLLQDPVLAKLLEQN